MTNEEIIKNNRKWKRISLWSVITSTVFLLVDVSHVLITPTNLRARIALAVGILIWLFALTIYRRVSLLNLLAELQWSVIQRDKQ